MCWSLCAQGAVGVVTDGWCWFKVLFGVLVMLLARALVKIVMMLVSSAQWFVAVVSL